MADDYAWDTDHFIIANGTSGSPRNFAALNDWAQGQGGDPAAAITEVVENGMYLLSADVNFGDGVTSTYFQSKNGEQVYFADGEYFTVTANATLELGDQEDVLGLSSASWNVFEGHTFMTGGSFLMSASLLYFRDSGNGKHCYFNTGSIDWKLSSIVAEPGSSIQLVFQDALASLELDRVSIIDFWFPRFDLVPDNMNKVLSFSCSNSFLLKGNVTIIEPIIVNSGSLRTSTGTETHVVAKDSEFNLAAPTTIGKADSDIIEQYTCNIHTKDKDGADLASVDVDCEYAHIVEGSDSKTYKCIQNHTAVDATHKPITGSDWASFWELYDAGGGLGGAWDTGFDYKSGTEEFSTTTTDANGDITEQVVQYKKWVGTSEVLEARIHKFTFSHASYPDFVMNDIIVGRPIVWEFDIGQSTSDLAAIVAGELATYDPPTRAELTTDKDSIITEVDANEIKIDALL